MADKNFKSYENFGRCTFRGVVLRPENPLDWDDTMKVFRCRGTSFERFDVTGSREDVVDVGRETNDCLLERFTVKPSGQYVLTCKGGSNGNHFSGGTSLATAAMSTPSSATGRPSTSTARPATSSTCGQRATGRP